MTGFGVVSPIGVGREEFLDALRAGRSGVGPISRFDCSRFEARVAGEVKESPPLPEDVRALAKEDPKIGFAYAACAEAMASAGLALRFRRGGDIAWPKILLSGGLGFLGFGLLRLVLLAFYRENLVWFNFWEESTELMGVAGAGAVLWIFRKWLWTGRVAVERGAPSV